MPAILSSRTDVRAIAILTSRSDVRAVPFCSWLKDLVPSMSDMSVDYNSGNGGTWSVTRNAQSETERAILTSRSDIRDEPLCHG